jgi:site-specific recombinase XerD
MESVKGLLGHASIATTIDTYGHLTVEDARATLAAAGWFTGREVQW